MFFSRILETKTVFLILCCARPMSEGRTHLDWIDKVASYDYLPPSPPDAAAFLPSSDNWVVEHGGRGNKETMLPLHQDTRAGMLFNSMKESPPGGVVKSV